MAASQPGAFHTFEDTLATGIITGEVSLTTSRAQIDPTNLLPADWVCGLELRVYCPEDFIMASADDNANEVPLQKELWFPISTINAWKKLWFRSVAGTPSLFFIIEGKVRGSTL